MFASIPLHHFFNRVSMLLLSDLFFAQDKDEETFTFVQMADRSYLERPQAGIKNRSSFNNVIQKYGNPDHSFETSNGTFLAYFDANPLFLVKAKATTDSRGVFRTKKRKG